HRAPSIPQYNIPLLIAPLVVVAHFQQIKVCACGQRVAARTDTLKDGFYIVVADEVGHLCPVFVHNVHAVVGEVGDSLDDEEVVDAVAIGRNGRMYSNREVAVRIDHADGDGHRFSCFVVAVARLRRRDPDSSEVENFKLAGSGAPGNTAVVEIKHHGQPAGGGNIQCHGSRIAGDGGRGVECDGLCCFGHMKGVRHDKRVAVVGVFGHRTGEGGAPCRYDDQFAIVDGGHGL